MKYQETDVLELKQELTADVKKEILSFLNTDGGTVVIGVKDDGEIVPITDNAIRDNLDTTISSWIQEAFYPRPYNLIKHHFNDDDVMVIEIQGGHEKPYYLKEKGPKPSGVYKRVGRSCRQASEDEILSMIMESKGYYYEKDLSEEQELTFKYFFSTCEDQNIPHTKRNLKSLNIITSDNKYTNLGLLLSDQSPILVKFAKYDSEMNFVVKKEFSGSILKVLDNVLEHVSNYNDVSAVIDGKSFKRIETVSYPGSCLREGILNAFAHADYFIRSNIKVELFPDSLKITNPGGIYKASLDDIMSGVQTYRNPGLVNILNKLKYIENFGTGIPRIMQSYSSVEANPVFNPSLNFFMLTLPNLNAMSDPIGDPIDDPLSDPIAERLTDFELILLSTIRANPGCNASKLLEIMKEKDDKATLDKIKNSLKRNLTNLCEFRGPRNSGGYYLKN